MSRTRGVCGMRCPAEDKTARLQPSDRVKSPHDRPTPPGSAPSPPSPREQDATPAMRQYQQFKAQYPGYVLFFRMGDFYEMFWEDAKLCHQGAGRRADQPQPRRARRDDAIPMAGVPFHAVEGYLRKMIAAGHKVAICEQMEDPALAKGVVRREVVRLMTPGTLTDDPLLDGGSGQLPRRRRVQRHQGRRLSRRAGVGRAVHRRLRRDERTRRAGARRDRPASPGGGARPRACASGQPHEIAERDRAARASRRSPPGPAGSSRRTTRSEQVQRQWQVSDRRRASGSPTTTPASSRPRRCSSISRRRRRPASPTAPPCRRTSSKITSPSTRRAGAAWRSTAPSAPAAPKARCSARSTAPRTAMGGRLLRQWLRSPLCDLEHIHARQERDRGAARIAGRRCKAIVRAAGRRLRHRADRRPRWRSAARARAISRGLGKCLAMRCRQLFDRLANRCRVAATSRRSCSRSRAFCAEQADVSRRRDPRRSRPAPARRRRDRRRASTPSSIACATSAPTASSGWRKYQAQLAAETGIPSLKVGYNKVFGYYIEVTDAHRDKVPGGVDAQADDDQRRALHHAGAEDVRERGAGRAGQGDRAGADALRERPPGAAAARRRRSRSWPHGAGAARRARRRSRSLAQERRYCRPTIVEDRVLEIVDGRHPVLEQQLGSEFVANDVALRRRTIRSR